MEKILITGGAGFIGSHLAEELHAHRSTIVVFDNLSAGKPENLGETPHKFVKGDIRDYDSLKKAMEGCNGVYHLAAATSVVESMEEPEKYFDINTRGTLNVLRAAREAGVMKVVMASSAAVYGDSPELPKTEEMKPDPQSPYAISKLDGEYLCRVYGDLHGVPTVAARFFNVFGERQDPASPYAAAIPIFIANALSGTPISIYGDGEQTRDFVYIKDIVGSLIFLMDKGRGVYNIGYGSTVTINGLVKMLESIIGWNLTTSFVEERPGEIRHSYASIAKLTRAGFIPSYSLEKGLALTVKYWKEGIVRA